jgi:hypothetical protein
VALAEDGVSLVSSFNVTKRYRLFLHDDRRSGLSRQRVNVKLARDVLPDQLRCRAHSTWRVMPSG